MGCSCRRPKGSLVHPDGAVADGKPVSTMTISGETWSVPGIDTARHCSEDRHLRLIRWAAEMKTRPIGQRIDLLLDAILEVLRCDGALLLLRGRGSNADLDERSISLRKKPATSSTDDQTVSQPSVDQGILGQVWATGELLNVSDVRSQPKLRKHAPDWDDIHIGRSVLCMALKHQPDGVVFGVLQATRASSSSNGAQLDAFDSVDETMMQLLMSMVEQNITTQRLVSRRSQTLKHMRMKNDCLFNMLSHLVKSIGHQDLNPLVRAILEECKILFTCDRCSFYAVDTFRYEFVGYQIGADLAEDNMAKNGLQASVRSGIVEETHFPIEGLLAHVLNTGEVLSIPDAWADDRFTRAKDIETGFRTRTLLIAPLATSKGRVFAVLQCVNKTDRQLFNAEDEREIALICAVVQDKLQRILLNRNFAALLMGNNDLSKDVKDMYRGYNSIPVTPSDGRSSLRRISSDGTGRGDPLLDSSSGIRNDMLRLGFDHWKIIDGESALYMRYIWTCLEQLKIPSEFSLSKKGLRDYVSGLQNRYSNIVSYHTWPHAFATFHISFMLMVTDSLDGVLPEIDVFAVLLAALGHDVEHPGVNNQFLINNRDELAFRYNDNSVLENHHASVTCKVLADALGHDYPNKGASKAFRKVVVATILGTDMARHQEVVTWLETTQIDIAAAHNDEYEFEPEDALKMEVAVLHCADLAHPALPWGLHLRMSVLCAEEFYAQYQKEQQLGLPTLPFMGKDPASISGLADTQVGFIQFVVLPLWSAFDRAASGKAVILEARTNIAKNKESWQDLGDGQATAGNVDRQDSEASQIHIAALDDDEAFDVRNSSKQSVQNHETLT